MFGKFLRKLFNSNVDYCPRFIDKNAYKKIMTDQVVDLDDYKQVKSHVESLSYPARVLHAYSLVRKY